MVVQIFFWCDLFFLNLEELGPFSFFLSKSTSFFDTGNLLFEKSKSYNPTAYASFHVKTKVYNHKLLFSNTRGYG